jgi:hypothetical protein
LFFPPGLDNGGIDLSIGILPMSPLMKWLKFLGRLVRQRSVLITVITLGVILLGSVGVNYFEQRAGDSNIRSVWDGLWWAVVTIATVGYGDRFPVSIGGRIVGFLLMFFGVGMMSLFTATIASLRRWKRWWR